MFNSASEIIEAITEKLASLGITVFWSKEYPGHFDTVEHPSPDFTVGVVAGYRPGEAAIYSVVFRYHLLGPDEDQLFQYHVTSDHNTHFETVPLASDRIRGESNRKGVRHLIPDHWHTHAGGFVYKIMQFMDDADFPLEDKVEYAGDIFAMFIERSRGTLLPRFSRDIIPYVSPDHSNMLKEIETKIMLRGRALDEYFWRLVVSNIAEELLDDPAFPFPPA